MAKNNKGNDKYGQPSTSRSNLDHPKFKQHEPSNTIGVFNVHYKTSGKELSKKFEQFGEVQKFSYVKDPNTKDFKGYAFIKYKNLEDAKRAVQHSEKIKFGDREAVVNFSSTKGPTGKLSKK